MSETAKSIDPEEIEKFSALAERWWDPAGEFRPLHRLNPARLRFVRDQATDLFGGEADSLTPLQGLSVLDIGCGGGLLCEPLTRLGAEVLGIDASERNISIAAQHAAEGGLAVRYRVASAEELAEEAPRFDLIVNMEVVEHVADVASFLAASCQLLRPGGLMVLSTLNRTAKAFAMAVVGAEYLLRWLPRGTHDWRRFQKPSEIARHLRANGLEIVALTGLRHNPIDDSWRLDPRDLDVNYLLAARKAP